MNPSTQRQIVTTVAATRDINGASDTPVNFSLYAEASSVIVNPNDGTVALRFNKDGTIYAPKLTMGTVSPLDFGAIGDDAFHPLSSRFGTLSEAQIVYPTAQSLSDQIDTVSIEKALVEAVASSRKLVFPSGFGSYLISRELIVPSNSNGLLIEGNGSTLKAAASGLRSLMVLRSNRVHFSDLTFRANTLAKYGLLHQGSGLSTFTRCHFNEALVAGEYLDSADDDEGATVNDSITYRECGWENNGTIYYTSGLSSVATDYNIINHAVAAGTVSIANTGHVVTGSGTAFLSLGLRPGDFICVGFHPSSGSAQFGQIASVDSNTQITCGADMPFTATLNNVGYIIGKGGGHWEKQASDNNINQFHGGLARHNCVNFAFYGLYGPTMVGVQNDYAPFFGTVLGMTDDTATVNNACIMGGYHEAIGGGHYLFGNCLGFTIASPVSEQGVNNYKIGNFSKNSGIWMGVSGIGINQKAIGFAHSSVPVQRTDPSEFLISGKWRAFVDSFSIGDGSTSIPCTYAAVDISHGSDVTMSATPQISAPTDTSDRQEIELLNTGAGKITFIPYDVLPSSAIVLGEGRVSLELAFGQAATFRWNLYNWYLISTTGTLT